MRLPMILITICALAAGTAFVGDAGEKMDSIAAAMPARVFNALQYGAVGDDKTDNTEAFSACLKALVEAGGGRMYLPEGIYHGHIVIPPVAKGWVSLEITGEREPSFLFGTIGANSLPRHGTIVKGMAESGRAVIRAEPSPGSYQNFSRVYVIIRNLDVRTSDDPDIGGIDLHHAQQCKLENVFVNTGVYNVQASKPTHRTVGISTPACNNAALTILRNVIVTGYHTGILVNEHTDGDNVTVASNVDGLEFAFAHHASRFGRVGAYRCSRCLTVTGRHGFCIEQLNVEIAGPGQTDKDNAWQTTEFNIYDPDNLGTGDLNWWVVEGNVGAVEKFTKSGGEHVRARRIGSHPLPAENSAK